MSTVATLWVKLGLDSKAYKSGVDSALKSTRGLSSSAGGALMSIGKVAAVGFGAVAAGAILASKVAGDFEEQINILSVAARSSGSSMEDLSDAALKVGADASLVGISASEAADAMTNFYKAGLDTNEIMGDMQGYLSGTAELSGALRSSVDLAAASELDLAAASDIVAIAMSTFGLGADEAETIANSFVQAADASVTSVGELASAMVNFGPTAAAMGLSLGETNTALALLSERGIVGSEAGTALKSMYSSLLSGTAPVTSALEAMNVSLFTSEGAIKAPLEIIGDLQAGMEGMTEAQRFMTMQTLAGTFGMKAMSTLMEEGTEGWIAMEGAISDAATAQESADARTEGLNAAVEQLQGAWETFMIKVGKPLIDNIFTPLIQLVGELVTNLTESGAVGKFSDSLAGMIENLKNFINSDEAVETAQKIKGGFNFIRDAITTVIDAFKKDKGLVVGVLAGIASIILVAVVPAMVAAITTAAPLIAIFLIVAAVAYLLYTAWTQNFGGIQEKTAEWWANLKEVFLIVVEWLQTNIPTAIKALSDFWTGTLLPAIEKVSEWINANLVPLFNIVVDWLKTNIPAALQTLSTFWTNTLLPAMTAVWEWINANLMPLFNALGTLLGVIVKKKIEELSRVWNDTLKPALEAVWKFISVDLMPVWMGLLDGFKAFADFIGGGLKKAFDNITSWISNLTDFVNDLIDAISGVGGEIQSPASANVSQNSVIDQNFTVKSISGANDAAGGFRNGDTRIIELLQDLVDSALDEQRLAILFRDAMQMTAA